MIKKHQKLLVFQQNNRAIAKVKWIRQHGKELFKTSLITIKPNLPAILDNSFEYLPKAITSDLVLDYLKHPDLSYDLTQLCIENNIPIIGSGKKIKLGKRHFTPTVCCNLNNSKELGNYGKCFGKPKLKVSIKNNKIEKIKIKKGAPCGSTWKASKKMIGLSIESVPTKYGLNIQFFCTGNTSEWDPINSKNPVHIAAELHKNAMIKAIKDAI